MMKSKDKKRKRLKEEKQPASASVEEYKTENDKKSRQPYVKKQKGYWWRFALCVLATLAIVTAGIIVPDRLLSVKRKLLYGNQVTVAADDIEPFGEAYNSTKNRLLSVIRFQNERENHDIDVVYVDEEYNSNGIDGATLYKKGTDKLNGFFEKVDCLDLAENNILYSSLIKADNRDIYEMEWEAGMSDEYNTYLYITSDVETGLPLTCTINTWYPDQVKLWKSLLAAYEETMGVGWTDATDYTMYGYDAYVQDETSDPVSGNAAGGYYDSDNLYDDQYAAGWYSFKAISTDGAFMLIGQAEDAGAGYTVNFRLTERY